MKWLLVLVVMGLVGVALSKSTYHKRSFDQVKKRAEMEKLLDILLKSNDKKGTTARRDGDGNGDRCRGNLAAVGTAIAGLDLAAPDFTNLIDAILTVMNPTKKRALLHSKRGTFPLNKRGGGGGGPEERLEKCIDQAMENLDFAECTEDLETLTTDDTAWIDFFTNYPYCEPTPLAFFETVQTWFTDNASIATECLWALIGDELDDKKK